MNFKSQIIGYRRQPIINKLLLVDMFPPEIIGKEQKLEADGIVPVVVVVNARTRNVIMLDITIDHFPGATFH